MSTATSSGAKDQVARLLTLVPYLHTHGQVRLDHRAGRIAVDPDLSLRLVRLFAELNKMGTTIVLATHELPLLDNFSFPRIMLEDGQVSFRG